MKHCQPCNLEFPNTYRFCGSCGGPLSDSVRCPGCGELAEGKWTFCTNCGGQLSSESTSDQTSRSKTPEQSDRPASLFSSPTLPLPPQTVTLPLSEQSTAPRRQEPEITLREWYSDADLFDETTLAGAAPIPPRDLVPVTNHPVPQVTAPLQPKDERGAPTLTMLSAYGESEAPSQFRWWHGAILGLFILVFLGALGVGG